MGEREQGDAGRVAAQAARTGAGDVKSMRAHQVEFEAGPAAFRADRDHDAARRYPPNDVEEGIGGTCCRAS